jgi:hypothetical protein
MEIQHAPMCPRQIGAHLRLVVVIWNHNFVLKFFSMKIKKVNANYLLPIIYELEKIKDGNPACSYVPKTDRCPPPPCGDGLEP